jgi:hypothetical protein
MKRPTDVDRRTYVKGVAVAVLAGGVPVAATAAQGQGQGPGSGRGQGQGGGQGQGDDADDGDDRPMEIPVAQPFVGDLDGEDLFGDGEFDVENRYDGDPAEGQTEETDREWVLHYTTSGAETQDYPAALINLRERLEDPVTLDDLEGDGSLAFDYYVGPDHDQYIPGQVYLVIQTAEQEADDEAWGVYRNVRKGGPVGEWATLDVIHEMKADEPDDDGEDPIWRALEIDVDPEGFRADFGTFTDAILQQAMQTRDQTGNGEVDSFGNVFERFGDDAELLAVGLGSGSSRTPTMRDIYYDDYRLEVGDEEHTFELPAALQADADFRSDGQVIASLSFDEMPEGIDLEDVDEDSIRLYPYAQMMPPTDEGADANRVEVDDDEIEARFPPGRVRTLDLLGSESHDVVVAGQFDVDHVAWFFGIGTVSLPGN